MNLNPEVVPAKDAKDTKPKIGIRLRIFGIFRGRNFWVQIHFLFLQPALLASLSGSITK